MTFRFLNIFRYKVYILIGLLFLLSVVFSLTFENTYDNGDSIVHYLISHYSFKHPSLFLNHWGKPLFILFSSPFAQFGFKGIKIFNCLLAAISALVAYLVAKKSKINNPILVVVFIYFAPNYFLCQFSGLTEILFGLFLVSSYYFFINDKKELSILLISFLPFVRTEGWIIGIIYFIFIMFQRQWKLIPFFFIGNLIYGIIGFFFYKDFWWAFNQNPYLGKEIKYGSGTLFHFVDQYPYVIGIPLFGLLIAGCINFLLYSFNKVERQKNIFYEYQFFLLFGCCCAFFVAHSIFWRFGLFRSYGLKRVLVALIPLNSIISLYGFNWIVDFISKIHDKSARVIKFIIVLFVLVFPIIGNKASIHIPSDFKYDRTQNTIRAATNWIKLKGLENRKIYYHHPTVAIELELDPFDNNVAEDIRNIKIKPMQIGSIIIWDEWYALTEAEILKDDLDKNINIIKLKSFYFSDLPEYNGKDNFEVVVYEVFR